MRPGGFFPGFLRVFFKETPNKGSLPKDCDSPDLRIPISWKKGFRGQNPLFPIVLAWRRELSVKKSPFFSARECRRNGDFLTEKLRFPASVGGEGKGGFLDPEILFFKKWGFGALSGVGGIPTQG